MALVLLTSLAAGLHIGTPAMRANTRAGCPILGLHDLSAKAMDGTDIDLSSLSGKKVIALNVASK